MVVKTIDDITTSQHHIADCYGAISRSHQCALEQFRKIKFLNRTDCNILNIGTYDHIFIEKLKALISSIDKTEENILDQSRYVPQNISFQTINVNSIETNQHISEASQDAIIAHLIDTEIPNDALFSKAHRLIKEDGVFSVITTTHESFPVAQRHLADFIAKGGLISNIVGHYYKTVVKNTTVAADEESLLTAVKSHHFEILFHERIEIPMHFETLEELELFAIEGGWFISRLSIPMIPKSFLLQNLRRTFEKMFTFPYQDTHVIDVVMAKKKQIIIF